MSQNASQPIIRLLFNEVLNSHWGLYVDSGSVKNLIIKRGKNARTIPATETTVKRSTTSDGRFKVTFLEYVKTPVVEGFPVEGGFEVERIEEHPGEENDNYYPRLVPYATKLEAARPLISGLIDDLDVLQMEDNLLALIKDDTDRANSQCFVEVKRAYIVNDIGNNDASGFTITWPDATQTLWATVNSNPPWGAGALAIQFNADTTPAYGGAALNALLKAYRIGANKYLITSINPGLNFKIGTLNDTTVEHRFLSVAGLDSSYKVNVKTQPGEWTQYSAYLYDISAANMGTTGFTAYANGAAHPVTHGGAVATLVGNINSATDGNQTLAQKGVYATYPYGGALIYLYAPQTLTFSISLPYTNTLVITKAWSPDGTFAGLSYNKLRSLFLHTPHDGVLAEMNSERVQPLKDTKYRKYTLSTYYSQGNFTGPAGGFGKVLQVVELYVKESEAMTNKFKNTNGNYMDETVPQNANVTLDTLIVTTLLSP